MKIADNTTVQIEFSIKDAEGNIIESTPAGKPAPYIHGKEMMLQVVEDALLGKEAGESISITVTPEDGFGKKDDALIQEIPLENFSEFKNLEIGNEFQTVDEEGNPMFVEVLEIGDKFVTCDGNHPFADMDLTFKIEVKDVKETTEEDLKKIMGGEHDHEGGCCGGDDMKDDPSCNSQGGCGCCGGH